MGMNSQVGNHNSLMLPGNDRLFLVNARGLQFCEVTASNLLVCDLEGRVVRGHGEIQSTAFNIHTRIHLQNPQARCVLHVHPVYATAFTMVAGARLELAHHNMLLLDERIAYDDALSGPALDLDEGDRIARALGDRNILMMTGHGVTTVAETVHEAFDLLYFVERNCMWQMLAMGTGRPMVRLPESMRWGSGWRWGERSDSRQHLDSWRRILDREEPDYAR